MRIATGRTAVPIAIVALTTAALLAAAKSDGYTPFVLALVALTAVVGVGLNILLGDRKSTRLNSSHALLSRMPSSA